MTDRATAVGLENLLGQKFRVLDHGFIKVVDYMGDDAAIVQAARVSYGRGTKTSSEDEALIRYLMRNRHTTPFEMCELKLHIKLPIFVARQWIRHRTANINEYSARYSILDREFYLPIEEDIKTQSATNNQGRGEKLANREAEQAICMMRGQAESAFDTYETLLSGVSNDAPGISRELARIGLPLSTFTQMYWKIDLHNLFHFLELRAHSHAQFEIRAYAEAILAIVEKWVPFAHKAFVDYRFNAVTLSSAAAEILSKKLRGQTVSQEESGLTKREWNELNEKFDLG